MSSLPFSISLPVYWEDTDAGGVVYHANYLRFLERVRSDYLRAMGVSQQALQSEQDRMFTIHSLQVDYRAPARLEDQLEVRLDSLQVGRASLLFGQSIWRRDAAGPTLLLTATVKAACLTASRFRPCAIPEHIRRLLPVESDNQNSPPQRTGTE